MNPGAMEAYLCLLRVASDVLDATEQYYASHGTSQGRFTVLALLNRTPDEPLNPADLADRAGVTRATMTGLLQGLENEGLVKRTSCNDDKRMCWVELTTKGRKYVDSVLPGLFRGVSDLMGEISEKDRKNLLNVLEKVSDRIHYIADDERRAAA
jgi:DNA-binding MarR family transcriptional regulator